MKLLYMPQVVREEGESVESFCHRLYYDFGFTNLKLCYNYTKDEELCFSKHIGFEALTFLDWNEPVPHTIDTKAEFLSKAQHRTIGDCELLLDMDNCMVGNVRFPSLQAKADWAYNLLRKEGYIPVMYASGGRGRHISAIIPKLREYHSYQRKVFKLALCQRFGADLMKASEGVMIALEGSKHRVTGRLKELVRR